MSVASTFATLKFDVKVVKQTRSVQLVARPKNQAFCIAHIAAKCGEVEGNKCLDSVAAYEIDMVNGYDQKSLIWK